MRVRPTAYPASSGRPDGVRSRAVHPGRSTPLSTSRSTSPAGRPAERTARRHDGSPARRTGPTRMTTETAPADPSDPAGHAAARAALLAGP
ncbi:hypothetical protein ABZW03_33205, partial [Kitasatospora sp. NPDC004799]